MGVEEPEGKHKASSGIPGLDFILSGGFPRGSVTLLQGESGTGKTTLGLQFLLEGIRTGEKCLFISLLQRDEDLTKVAHSHGWSMEGIHFEDISAVVEAHKKALDQTVFHASHTALSEAIDAIMETIGRLEPDRLVFDAVSEIRVLAESLVWYRNQLLLLIRFLTSLECTTLLISTESPERCEEEFRPLVDGVINMEQHSPNYGQTRRRLEVVKMRAMGYQSGYHDFRIIGGGLEVFPKLGLSRARRGAREQELIKTGVGELDGMLGGGLKLGSTCLFLGASGTGKSTLATLYLRAAARRGVPSAVFLFDEDEESFLGRAEGLGMELAPFVEEGLIRLRKFSIGEISPGELAQTVRGAVDDQGVRVVVIDSLTGYYLTMPGERLLLAQMHELLCYLRHRGVLSLLLVAQHGFTGEKLPEPRATSLLADAVVGLRFLEVQGTIRTALSVFKRRYGPHEKIIREMIISSEGVKVGGQLEEEVKKLRS